MATNLKSMSVAELLQMRRDIDAALQSRRGELEQMLGEIGGGNKTNGRGSKLAGKKVAPKYRHPKTGDEWSGRGGIAKWLAAEIKAGTKKESFLIK
jgi:DNA-binding protein H-NS